MLKLQSISGALAIEFPYLPEMLLWKYLRDIITLTAGFEIKNSKPE